MMVNGLNVFLINLNNFTIVFNILENKELFIDNGDSVAANVFKENEKHPLFVNDTEFRISLFNCPPFVIRLKQKNGSYKYDGVEYRFIKEVTKLWHSKIIVQDVSNKTVDPWCEVANHVLNKTSELAMCSIWMSERNAKKFDMSHYFDSQCTTFLVPKPSPLNQASYIYLPLSHNVWFCFTASLFIISGFLYIISNIGIKMLINNDWKRSAFKYFTTAFTESVNIATTHGLAKFPVLVPIKFLVISWMIVSLLVGTGYSSGYTSILTSPRYSKPIDTIKDFLDQNIYWGELVGQWSPFSDIFESENKDYADLSKRMMPEAYPEDRSNRLAKGNYAAFVKVLSNNYVTDTERLVDYVNSLRLMKSCLLRYYSVYILQRHSPYTYLFNAVILKYLETGIVQYWFRDINARYGQSYMQTFFDTNKRKVSSEPKTITLENVIGAFYLLLTGHLIAGLICFIEITMHKQKLRKLIKKPKYLH